MEELLQSLDNLKLVHTSELLWLFMWSRDKLRSAKLVSSPSEVWEPSLQQCVSPNVEFKASGDSVRKGAKLSFSGKEGGSELSCGPLGEHGFLEHFCSWGGLFSFPVEFCAVGNNNDYRSLEITVV